MHEIIVLALFAATYAAIALGRVPGLRLDRAGAALAGAAGMVASGALSLEEAYRAVDLNTITLLLGMMIVVADLRLSGLFHRVSIWAATRARRPIVLLAAIALVSGIFSAFLVNDTVCLVLTPLVCELTQRLRRNPVPYLLGVAMASNAGSVATITGNPQNMIIGSLSRIPYTAFAAALAPVAAVALLLTIALLALTFRTEFWTAETLVSSPQPAESAMPGVERLLLARSLSVTLAMMAGFFAGLPPPGVAIGAGAVMLITGRFDARKVYAEIDWPLLAMFAGLFIVVAGLDKIIAGQARAVIGALHLGEIPVLTAIAAVLSNIVSNVPAVLVLEPFIEALREPRRAWLALAMAATLAGNLTLVGSIANLIVARGAESRGVRLGFWTYLKTGVPLTVLSLLAGIALL
ncbi:MAG TPA: SLC13 family permease [Steroidobacteraceae bacterium]|nr:SLC13 family permease [Steroidobacteraceae bacterium]